jgi:phage portal protein BeeE
MNTASELMQQAAMKAVTGPGANVYANGGVPIGSMLLRGMNNRKFMEQAQRLYYTNPWIRSAEGLISRKLSTTPYQVLTGIADDGKADTEVKSGPLIERLKAGSPRQRLYQSHLWQITIRHAGLCNNAFWYDRPGAAPEEGVIYINPARMTPIPDDAGYLSHWMLDVDEAKGFAGYRFETAEILWFQYEPADVGFLGHGLVFSALMKAQLSTAVDRHAIHTIESGGRLQGFLTPQKDDYFSDTQFNQTQRELRNITELDDSAKRMVLLRKPVEFIPSTMNPSELDLLGLARISKEDIYEIWGVPRSQTGGVTEIGMNSGDRIAYEEAALQQNAIHPRAVMVEQTMKQLLMRYGDDYRLHFMQPTFDDERPKYEMLAMAKHAPLTRDERRAILDLPPVGKERGGDIIEQDPTILQIDPPLPLARSLITGRLASGSAVEPPGTPMGANAQTDALNAARGYRGPDQGPGKASLDASVGEAIAERILERGDHFLAKPFDLDGIAPKRLIAKALAAQGIGGGLIDEAVAQTHLALKAIISEGHEQNFTLDQYAEAVRFVPPPMDLVAADHQAQAVAEAERLDAAREDARRADAQAIHDSLTAISASVAARDIVMTDSLHKLAETVSAKFGELHAIVTAPKPAPTITYDVYGKPVRVGDAPIKRDKKGRIIGLEPI